MSKLETFLFHSHAEDDETIVHIVHKHWLVGVRYLFFPFLAFCVAWVVLYMAPFKAMAYLTGLWALVSLVWFLRNFFDYYLDAWILTDQGIIDVEWHGWFHRESTRVLYSDVQGVSYEIQGIWATLLRFGVVSVEKISTGNAISLEYVPYPRSIEGMILRHMEGYLHSKNLKDARHVQELLSHIVAESVQREDFKDDEDEEFDEDEEDEDDSE